MHQILNDKRPARPPAPALSDSIWLLMKMCWIKEPAKRLDVDYIVEFLGEIAVVSLNLVYILVTCLHELCVLAILLFCVLFHSFALVLHVPEIPLIH